MASNPNKGPIYNLLWHISHSPLKILEFAQYLLLVWVLLQALAGSGGFLPYGSFMAGISKSLLWLAGLHALVLVFRKERPTLEWEMVLPLPFIAYAWLHYQFLSPTPWLAARYLVVLVQAYLLFLIVFNSIHGRKVPKAMVYCCQLVMGVALLAAFLQFYLFPIWSPVEGRIRNPDYAGGAAGFLQDPVNLGALLLPFLPLMFMLVAKHYRTSPVWMLQAILALATVIGLLLCSHFYGIIGMLILLLAMPLYVTGYRFSRRRIWKWLLIGIPVFLLLVWFGTGDLRERLLHYVALPSDLLGSASLQVARAEIMEHPVLGQGLGSFASAWERHVPAGIEGSSLYPTSTYAALWAEMGLVGLLLAAVPLLFFFIKAFRAWRGIPFLRMDPDIARRVRDLPPDHPVRRQAERRAGTTPTRKVFLGGLLFGLGALLFYEIWDYAFQLPVTLFLFGALAACLAAFLRGQSRKSEQRWYWLVPALLPVLLASWSVSFGLPRFHAAHLVFVNQERLDYLLEDPGRIFADPGSISLLAGELDLATRLDPDNGEAWEALGSARLAALHASLVSGEAVARDALPALEQGLRKAPFSWVLQYNLARAEALNRGDFQRIRSYAEAAIRLAPQRPEAPAFLGSMLLLEDSRSAEGRELLKRAVALDPGYTPATRTLERLQPGASPGERASAVSSATPLVAQFRIRIEPRERIRGVGLPDFKSDELNRVQSF